MSLADYNASKRLVAEPDASFHALLFALMRRAGGENLLALRAAFPEECAEVLARYNAPGALLLGEPGYAEIQRERERFGLPPTGNAMLPEGGL